MNRYLFPILIIGFLSIFNSSSFAQSQFQNEKVISAAVGYKITPLLGDYDGDGDMDILGTGSYVRNSTSNNATILLRNDGGEFVAIDVQLPWFYSGGMYQWADIDNDNDLDIIAGGCSLYCYDSKAIYIYRNDGADVFTLIEGDYNLIGGQLFSLIDYNNDGLIDIEVATQSDNDGSVVGHTFYINTGAFTFQKTFELEVTAGEVAWGDLDNDGWKDFVLLNKAYKNLGDGTFEEISSPEPMQQNLRHYFFDADLDGDQDVITSNGILMVNDGQGQLSYDQVIIPYNFINSLVIADFDGDGFKDIVASGGNSMGSKTELFRSNGDGTFTVEEINERYSGTYYLALADMDEDMDPDIVLSGVFESNIVILENGLSKTLSKPEVPANLHSSINAGVVTLSWDEASDVEQIPSSLKYNVYLMYDDDFKIVPNADITTGRSFIPGTSNVFSSLQLKLTNIDLPEGYFRWSVQSIDDELNMSQFAVPQEFTLYKNILTNAPTNLTANFVSDRSISLTWSDNSTDETSFIVERSTHSGNSGFEIINQVSSNTVNFIDNSVLPRSIYYYRIRIDGPSVAYSNIIRVETKAAISIAPTNVRASILGSASVNIEWDYPATEITGFAIERSQDNKLSFAIVGFAGKEERTYKDQQLESGRIYYYRLFAVNGEDVSEYSSIVKVSMPLKEFSKVTLPSLMYDPLQVTGGGIAWGDFDNDGYDDLFLGYKAQLFRNNGDGTFEQFMETGITSSENAYEFVAVWGDYDNDGLLDLFYYNNIDRSWLYRGNGDGTFSKVNSLLMNDRSEIMNATWSDIDMDGDLDLAMTGGRYVYRNDGNDTFVRIDFPDGIPAGYYYSSIASWADYDDDGDPDVFLGNYGKNEFFRNNGNGSFTAITDQRVTVDYNYDCCPTLTSTVLWTDFNKDNKLDLTVFHAGGPLYLYANNDNKLDSAFYFYAYDQGNWRNLFWTDYDNDSDLDLFSMGGYNSRTIIWENKDGLPFRQLKGGPLYDYVPSGASFSWNDFDNDGFSDLFKFDSEHQVYKNLSNGNNWIKIKLRGRASNSTGLGAKVYVKSRSGWQRSDITTYHGHRVQQGFMQLFGLGNSLQVDSIKIIWPSGNRQFLTDVDVNQVILVDEYNAQEKVAQAPSNLTARALFPSSIKLMWTDRSEDETGFVIEMMTGDGPFEEVGTVGANINSFKLDGLSTGIKYKFRVRASPEPINRWTNIAEVQIRLFTDAFAGDLTIFQSQPRGLAWGDPDGDNDPDLFVGSESFEPDAIYYNNNGVFERKHLRTISNYSHQAQWIDYDNDGHQDLHISVGGGIISIPEYLNDFLYKNDGTGQLVEQTQHILAQDGYPDFTAAWGDLNKDGYLEMVTSRSNNRPMVFLNLGGNIVQYEHLGLDLPSEGTILFVDLDNDRDLDVIAAARFYGYTTVYENNNGQFKALTNTGLPYSMHSFALEDFDNDGIHDILLLGQDQMIKLFLFDPISKMFKEKTNVFPMLGPVSKLSVADFDNNGFMDVFASGQVSYNLNTNRIYLNNGNLKFTPLEDTILEYSLFGTAVADVNKDGRLDLVALAGSSNSYNTRRHLLLGNETKNHWLRVRLKGVAVNRFGIGARIRLFTENMTQVRDIRSGSGSTFSDEQIAHFGLGPTTTIDYLKVEWPSGEDQWIANPTIDNEIVIEQDNTPGPPTPISPSNLVASLRNPGYIDLQWSDNSDNEKLFRIERAIGTNPFKPMVNVPQNTLFYTDSSFTNHTGHPIDVRYRVVAISYITVESVPSNEASVQVITGIEENQRGLIIFPSPASSKLFIQSDEVMDRISIIGGRGEIVKEISVQKSREVEVSVKDLIQGIYFIRITHSKGTIIRKILITADN